MKALHLAACEEGFNGINNDINNDTMTLRMASTMAFVSLSFYIQFFLTQWTHFVSRPISTSY